MFCQRRRKIAPESIERVWSHHHLSVNFYFLYSALSRYSDIIDGAFEIVLPQFYATQSSICSTQSDLLADMNFTSSG